MKNPCYDKATRTDCPDRHSGCGASCPKWAVYEKVRNKAYEKAYIEKKEAQYTTDKLIRQCAKSAQKRSRYRKGGYKH